MRTCLHAPCGLRTVSLSRCTVRVLVDNPPCLKKHGEAHRVRLAPPCRAAAGSDNEDVPSMQTEPEPVIVAEVSPITTKVTPVSSEPAPAPAPASADTGIETSTTDGFELVSEVSPITSKVTPVSSEPEPASAPSDKETEPSTTDSFELSAEDIKAGLLDSLYGTERGLNARSELRAEINELISQLEAKNPTPNPTEVLEKLAGEWRLVYTSNSALLGVLALGRLPLVTVGDLTQTIDSITSSVENKINLSGPFSRTAITTVASFEVRSPKRLQLRLERGVVATPELTGDLDLPTSVDVLGQSIDISQLRDVINPLAASAQGVFAQLNQLVSQVPELSVPLQSDQAQTWQLNTYVDEDLRVARGDRGAVFIYSRVY